MCGCRAGGACTVTVRVAASQLQLPLRRPSTYTADGAAALVKRTVQARCEAPMVSVAECAFSV